MTTSRSPAALASKPVPHLRQREIVPEMCAQFHQREPSGMLAPVTICAVVIRIVDARERGGTELGVFHRATLPAVGCGHPWDNSYRCGCRAALYKTMQGRAGRSSSSGVSQFAPSTPVANSDSARITR
jgi:hypothetical protein